MGGRNGEPVVSPIVTIKTRYKYTPVISGDVIEYNTREYPIRISIMESPPIWDATILCNPVTGPLQGRIRAVL